MLFPVWFVGDQERLIGADRGSVYHQHQAGFPLGALVKAGSFVACQLHHKSEDVSERVEGCTKNRGDLSSNPWTMTGETPVFHLLQTNYIIPIRIL